MDARRVGKVIYKAYRGKKNARIELVLWKDIPNVTGFVDTERKRRERYTPQESKYTFRRAQNKPWSPFSICWGPGSVQHLTACGCFRQLDVFHVLAVIYLSVIYLTNCLLKVVHHTRYLKCNNHHWRCDRFALKQKTQVTPSSIQTCFVMKCVTGMSIQRTTKTHNAGE